MNRCFAAFTIALIALAVPAATAAQTLPGSRELDDSRLEPAAWEATITLHRGDQAIPAGSATYRLLELSGDRWAYITTVTTQLGTATDTSIARRGTLAPISHRSHAVPRTLALDYEGGTVTGTYTPRDSAPRPISRVTDPPAFDAAMLDVVIGALPLAAGYTTRLPLYVEEQGGLAWADVRVAGDTVAEGTPAWDVRVGLSRYELRLLLARDDRRFLSGRVEYPNGATLTMTRR